MKFAILICMLAIFGTCFAQEQTPLDEARDRAYAATTNFMTSYSNIYSGEAYTDLLNKFSNIQTDFQTKNEEANQLIRTPYDEFYMNVSMGYGSGFEAECYYVATLNLYLDVARTLEYSYGIPSAYSQVVSELQTLSSSLLSDSFYGLSNKVYNALYESNVTAEIIDALIVEFNTEAANMLTRADLLLTAIGTEVDKLVTKFTNETADRVSRALDKLENIKQNYESCKLYVYYY